MAYTIVTNGQSREVLYWEQLTDKERQEVDYSTADDGAMFARYRGAIYDLSDFPRAPQELKPWDGALPDSFFSAILCRFVDEGERVIMGVALS
jgi:hypothetical protein